MENPEPPTKADVLRVLAKHRKNITEKEFNIINQFVAFSPDDFHKEKSDMRYIGETKGYCVFVKDYLFGEGRQGVMTVFTVAAAALILVFPNFRHTIVSSFTAFPDYVSNYVDYSQTQKSNWIVFSPEPPKEESPKKTPTIADFLLPNTVIAPISGSHPLATGDIGYTGYKPV